jgi:hypothetical protein
LDLATKPSNQSDLIRKLKDPAGSDYQTPMPTRSYWKTQGWLDLANTKAGPISVQNNMANQISQQNIKGGWISLKTQMVIGSCRKCGLKAPNYTNINPTENKQDFSFFLFFFFLNLDLATEQKGQLHLVAGSHRNCKWQSNLARNVVLKHQYRHHRKQTHFFLFLCRRSFSVTTQLF